MLFYKQCVPIWAMLALAIPWLSLGKPHRNSIQPLHPYAAYCYMDVSALFRLKILQRVHLNNNCFNWA